MISYIAISRSVAETVMYWGTPNMKTPHPVAIFDTKALEILKRRSFFVYSESIQLHWYFIKYYRSYKKVKYVSNN